MKWISVKDRLPLNEEWVLCCDNAHQNTNYKFFVARLSSDRKYWEGPSDFDIYKPLENVTHWMPLPEPPK